MVKKPAENKSSVLRKIITFLGMLFLVTTVGGYLLLFKPYLKLVRERISSKPVTVETVYVNVTGDSHCAKLYLLDQMVDGKPIITNKPLFLYLPINITSPINGELAVSDNIFVLKGYRYKWVETNLLTNTKREFPAARFDVISWRIVPPYKKWAQQADEQGMIGQDIATDPVSQTYSSSDHNRDLFIGENSIDCLQ